MIFLDANIFIYAYYKPTRKLTINEKEMKVKSKNVIRQVNNGLETLTSVVHISEISNILKKSLGLEKLNQLLFGIFSKSNITIVDVTSDDYLMAISLTEEYNIDPNDCLAIYFMERYKIKEIFTFDNGIRRVKGIKCLP